MKAYRLFTCLLSLSISLPAFAADSRHRDTKSRTVAADPNVSGDFSDWDRIQLGEEHYTPKERPRGLSGQGAIVAVVPDPLKREGRVYKLKVSPEANFKGYDTKTDRVDLLNSWGAFSAHAGEENWVHLRVMFPSTGDSFHPTRGEYNWIFQYHQDNRYEPFMKSGAIKIEYPELCWGVTTVGKLPNGERGTELLMRIEGGDDRTWSRDAEHWIYTNSPLEYDHWYDMMAHVIWAADPARGLVEWWVDGKLVYTGHAANLWRRPDNTLDQPYFMLSNYRVHSELPSTIYFSRLKIGPSHDSVLF
jgi:hypothetical protein